MESPRLEIKRGRKIAMASLLLGNGRAIAPRSASQLAQDDWSKEMICIKQSPSGSASGDPDGPNKDYIMDYH